METGSLNEFVRESLSSKKEISRLFSKVLADINIKSIPPKFSSLFSFISNLCFGAAGDKFKKYLFENIKETMPKLMRILENYQNNNELVTLWLAIINLLINLCTMKEIRLLIGENFEGILKYVIDSIIHSVDNIGKFGWVLGIIIIFREIMKLEHCLGILVNVSLEDCSHLIIISGNLPEKFNLLLSVPSFKESEIIKRIFNLCAKMSKTKEFCHQFENSPFLILKIFNDFNTTSATLDDSIR